MLLVLSSAPATSPHTILQVSWRCLADRNQRREGQTRPRTPSTGVESANRPPAAIPTTMQIRRQHAFRGTTGAGAIGIRLSTDAAPMRGMARDVAEAGAAVRRAYFFAAGAIIVAPPFLAAGAGFGAVAAACAGR